MAECFYMAGAAQKCIPTPEDLFPYHSWGPRRLTGTHDDLLVRVIYVRSPGELLMVSVENGDIDPAWPGALSALVHVPEEKIMLSVTHTHTAPYIGGYWPENVEDVEKSRRYAQVVWETLTAAVKEAMENPCPVTLQSGSGSCSVNVNRDLPCIDGKTGKKTYKKTANYHGYSDKTVEVMRFVRQDGTTLGLLFNYSVHSSMLFGTRLKDGGQLVSGDLAGYAMKKVEKALGKGAVAMFTMAPAADADPRYNTAWTELEEETGKMRWCDYGEGSFAVVDALAGELAGEVLLVCSQMQDEACREVRCAAKTILVPGKRKNDPKRDEENGVCKQQTEGFEPAEDVPIPLCVCSFGKLALVGIGCETSSQNSPAIRDIMKSAGCERCIIATQCNGSSSYMSDEEGYQYGKFSAMASHMMPEAIQCMYDGIRLLAEEVKGGEKDVQ